MRFFKQILVGIIGLSSVAVVALAATTVDHHGMEVDGDDHQACVECHDDIIAQTDVPGGTGGSHGNLSSHPVDTAYPPPLEIELFNSASSIEEKGLRLAGGKITCLSCHDLHNSGPKHLVISNVGSKLCLTCHRR